MATVILGGGIIGLSTAYYLSLATTTPIHIIDSSPALLASASGFAGGFLAADWFAPQVASLGSLSFRLHRELAEQFAGPRRWGYAGSRVYGLARDASSSTTTRRKEEEGPKGGDWLVDGTSRAQVAPAEGRQAEWNPDGSPAVWTPQAGYVFETVAEPENCAQIEPRELCEFLIQECRARGVQVHLSTMATGVVVDEERGVLKGLKLSSTATPAEGRSVTEIECKNIVIAAGAWTPRVFETLFPRSEFRVPIEPLAGHSLVVKSPRYTTPFINPSRGGGGGGGGSDWLCYSIYCNPGPHWSYSPEAFARLARNGETEVWIGGLNDSALPLPELATDVKALTDPASVKDLRKTTVQMIGSMKGAEEPNLNQDDLETIREGLCFRPVSQRGSPIIGKVSETSLGIKTGGSGGGVWIASGHGPWGISLSLGTGKVMSEMLMGQKPSADVASLRVG